MSYKDSYMPEPLDEKAINPTQFDFTRKAFCYGLADVYFSDSTSILTTQDPLDSVLWTYNGVQTVEEIGQDHMIHFED